MANALFAGTSPVEESSIISTRKSSRAHSTSTPHSYASPVAHAPFIAEALSEARASLAEGGIPTGSVLVRNGQIVARGHNRLIQRNSVVLHADIDCLESAGRQTAAFYKECTLYTTHAPCAICAAAVRLYGIRHVVVGENKTFAGDEALLRAHHVHVDVLDSKECHELLAEYISKNGAVWQAVGAHFRQ